MTTVADTSSLCVVLLYCYDTGWWHHFDFYENICKVYMINENATTVKPRYLVSVCTDAFYREG